MMKQYDSYKDSGVEWIGKIPSHWDRKRIKYLLSRSSAGIWGNDEKGDENDIVCFRVADFNYNIGTLKFDKITLRNIPKDQIDGRLLRKGDLLIEKSGGGDSTPVGRVVRYNYDGDATCSNFIHFISPNKIQSSDFLYYYFYALYANKENMLFFNQTTGIQNLKVGVYLSQAIFCPSYNEQKMIASYLDKKCGEIEKAIATQEKRVELLKELRQNIITQAVTRGINPNAPLKDSGVEWIGDIPEHWEMKRIKHVCKINGRVGYRGYTTADLVPEGEGAYTIGGKHISNNVLDLTDAEYISWDKYYESPEIMVKKGDIVTAQRGSLGKTAIIRDEIGEATINPSLVLLNHISIYNEFLYWYLVSTPTLIAIELLNTSTAVPMVSQWQISNINIPVPPLSEQQEIVSYIESQTVRLDKSIEKAEHQIELLQELKQSIITEVVTGKRKVV